MKYIKPLDGYRALAVGLVIFEHWLPPHSITKALPWGYIGVTMFFVLSGFLITSILLKSNEAISLGQIKSLHAFKTFYARRTLRIFPVYYLLLLGFCFFLPSIFAFDLNSRYALFTYTSNIYMYLREQWLGSFSPFWSLAVEEQFYLLWPLVILFSNKKHHFLIMLLFILGAVLFRITFSISGILSRGGLFVLLTPACIDSLALGGLLSLFYKNGKPFKKFKAVVNWLALISLVIFTVMFIYSPGLGDVTYRLLLSIMSLWLLVVIVDDKTWLIRNFFSNPVLVYIGKISYGIYLVHFFIPEIYMLISDFCEHHGYRIPFTHYAVLPFVGGNKQYALYFGFMIAVCSVSYFCFERPVNNLKRFFNY